jgi:ANTAR domain
VVRLTGTSGGIRAYGTASLVTRVGAGGVEDFAHVARVLHAAPDECGQLQLAVDRPSGSSVAATMREYRWWEGAEFRRLPVRMTWYAAAMPCSGQALAAQISVALAAQREIQQRSVAMTNRTVIGQAEGILMERLGIDADQAFAYLRRLSQTENRKLVTICNEIVELRQLPGS